MREVAAVEFEFLNLLGGDGAAELGGLRVYLGDIFAGDDYFLGNGADGKADVHACLLRDIEHNAFSLKFLKAGCDDGDAISAWGERRGDVDAVTVGFGGAGKISAGASDDNFGADDGGTGFIGYRAADEAVGLGGGQGGEEQEGEQGEAGQERCEDKLFWRKTMSLHCETSTKLVIREDGKAAEEKHTSGADRREEVSERPLFKSPPVPDWTTKHPKTSY